MEFEQAEIEIDEKSTEQPESQATDTGDQSMGERPEWLPEKFSNPEDLAEAYSELERKQGSESASSGDESSGEAEVQSLSEDKLNQFSEAWRDQDFSFTDEQYGEMEKMGLPRSFVDNYAEGQKAVIQAQANTLMATVGGEDAYKEMAQWAQQSLSSAEIDAFDKALEANTETARMAIQGLHAQYTKAVGKAPNLVQGNQAVSGSGSFQSLAEVKAAMGDPRYKTDSGYRESVAQKLSQSNI